MKMRVSHCVEGRKLDLYKEYKKTIVDSMYVIVYLMTYFGNTRADQEKIYSGSKRITLVLDGNGFWLNSHKSETFSLWDDRSINFFFRNKKIKMDLFCDKRNCQLISFGI